MQSISSLLFLRKFPDSDKQNPRLLLLLRQYSRVIKMGLVVQKVLVFPKEGSDKAETFDGPLFFLLVHALA